MLAKQVIWKPNAVTVICRRTVVCLRLVFFLALICDVEGTSAPSVTPFFPWNPGESECWQKEGRAQVAYSYLVFLLHTHTRTHACYTLQWNQIDMPLAVWSAFSFFGSGKQPTQPQLRVHHPADPVTGSATTKVSFHSLALSSQTHNYDGAQPACKWAEAKKPRPNTFQ